LVEAQFLVANAFEATEFTGLTADYLLQTSFLQNFVISFSRLNCLER